MTVYVKNKYISIRGSSFVENEQGEKILQVKGKAISPTRKKFVYTPDEKLAFTVRNKYWRLFRRQALIYLPNGKLYCGIKEKFIGRSIDIVRCKDSLTVENYGMGKGIGIIKNGELIGTYRWLTTDIGAIGRDSYEVTVNKDEELEFMVAVAIAVDNIRDSRHGERR